jgi:hypothetical protein
VGGCGKGSAKEQRSTFNGVANYDTWNFCGNKGIADYSALAMALQAKENIDQPWRVYRFQ